MPKPYVAVFMLALVWNAIPSAGAQTQQSEEKPYKINNGVTDWYTFSGYKRYHSECHVCHGPDGLGSSFAPSLVDSLKTMTYDQFLETVTNGKTEVSVSSQKKNC